MTFMIRKDDFQEKLASYRHKTHRNRRCEAARKEIIDTLKEEGRLDSYRHLIVFLSLDIPAVFEIAKVTAEWLGIGRAGMLDIFTEALDSYREVFFSQGSTRQIRMKLFTGALALAGARRAEKIPGDEETIRLRLLKHLEKFFEKAPAICGIMDFSPADLFPGGAAGRKDSAPAAGRSAEILNLKTGED